LACPSTRDSQERGQERDTDEGDEALDKEECNEKKKKTGRHAPSSPSFLRRHPVRPGRAGPFRMADIPRCRQRSAQRRLAMNKGK
jgi:hypothetical protein